MLYMSMMLLLNQFLCWALACQYRWEQHKGQCQNCTAPCGASMQVCRLAAGHLQGSTSCGAFAGWLQGARSQDGYGAFGGQQWAVCRMAAGLAFAGRLWGIQRMTPQHMFIGWLHGADNWWAMHTHSQCSQLLYVDSKPSSIHNSHPLPYIGNVH